MNIPVYMLSDKTTQLPPPENGICYIVAKNGVYKQIKNDFYAARVKVDGVGHYMELTDSVKLEVPKLPMRLLQKVESFFVKIYELHKSEAVVLLLANPKTQEWRADAPKQKVSTSGLHVKYEQDTVKIPQGFSIFGTIHSHASIGAFHSGTDDKDEYCTDGLHITVGNVDKPERSYAARWMICGVPCPAKIEDVIDAPALPPVNEEWVKRVEIETFTYQNWTADWNSKWKKNDKGVWMYEDNPAYVPPVTPEVPITDDLTLFPPIPSEIPPEYASEYIEFMDEADTVYLGRVDPAGSIDDALIRRTPRYKNFMKRKQDEFMNKIIGIVEKVETEEAAVEAPSAKVRE